MKLDISFDYKKILGQVGAFIGKYKVVLTSLAILLVFSYALLRINELSSPSANQARLNDQLQTYRKVQIDEETVKEVRRLVESNVKVNSEFGGRQNPFSE